MRESQEYEYSCPEGEEYEVRYYAANGRKIATRITYRGNINAIVGLPIAVTVTRGTEKRTIDLVHTEHWFYASRSYNLIRLLFDCDRIFEIRKILGSTKEKIVGINNHSDVLASFMAMQARLVKLKNKEINVALNDLKKRFVSDEDPNDCGCCLLITQAVFLAGVVMASGPNVKSLRAAGAAGMAVAEYIKQYGWHQREHTSLSSKVKND